MLRLDVIFYQVKVLVGYSRAVDRSSLTGAPVDAALVRSLRAAREHQQGETGHQQGEAVRSLRERKKEMTRTALWNAGVDLFVLHGFDNVSVAQIAAAAEVSKMTFFNYFPTKEDLVIGPMSEHIGEPAQVVRDRAPGESPVLALRRHYLGALARRDPVTGLCDRPNVVAVMRLVAETPSLMQRMLGRLSETEALLAAALGTDLRSRLSAAMILGVRHALTQENHRRLLDGETADEVYPSAVVAANDGFDLLESGLN